MLFPAVITVIITAERRQASAGRCSSSHGRRSREGTDPERKAARSTLSLPPQAAREEPEEPEEEVQELLTGSGSAKGEAHIQTHAKLTFQKSSQLSSKEQHTNMIEEFLLLLILVQGRFCAFLMFFLKWEKEKKEWDHFEVLHEALLENNSTIW